ncbi:MAG: hypothetical protein LDL33_00815 [Desulfomonile sp.]|nr:hypothetical protein [Desulfomonile sp.]
MYRNRDFDLQEQLPSNAKELTQDLELNTLFNTMAAGDNFLFQVAQKAVLLSLSDLDTIVYRQDILKDCLKNRPLVREMYQIPIEAMEKKRRHWMGIFTRYPAGILGNAREMLELFVELLRKLRSIADEHSDKFESEGFATLFAMIKKELDDEYLSVVDSHLKELKFRDGILISAELGIGNEGTDYVLRKPQGKNRGWVGRIFGPRRPVYTFRIADQDESGFRAVAELRDRGVNVAANALAQSAEHIDGFFAMLRTELAFYIGCLNLSEQLAEMGEPIAFPVAVAPSERKHSFEELYDVCLALAMKRKVVGNDVSADGKDLVMITGANQGGKSTFLRSIGVSQLMMQCGMFVPAGSFRANVCDRLFTHYKREEDATMKSGKLDEELGRMSAIVDELKPNSLVLFNESFAATNEREGSEIARQITRALLEKRIKIFFVTHLYDFAHSFRNKKMQNVFFLRAERQADGRRTFKLIEGEPLETSFGQDLYDRIFGGTEEENCPSGFQKAHP